MVRLGHIDGIAPSKGQFYRALKAWHYPPDAENSMEARRMARRSSGSQGTGLAVRGDVEEEDGGRSPSEEGGGH